MRKILLTSAAISALALSGPAIAANPDAAAKAPSDPGQAGLEAPAVAADDGFRLVEMDDPLEEEEGDDETDAPEEDDAEDDEYDLLAQDDEEEEAEDADDDADDADDADDDAEDEDLPEAG